MFLVLLHLEQAEQRPDGGALGRVWLGGEVRTCRKTVKQMTAMVVEVNTARTWPSTLAGMELSRPKAMAPRSPP